MDDSAPAVDIARPRALGVHAQRLETALWARAGVACLRGVSGGHVVEACQAEVPALLQEHAVVLDVVQPGRHGFELNAVEVEPFGGVAPLCGAAGAVRAFTDCALLVRGVWEQAAVAWGSNIPVRAGRAAGSGGGARTKRVSLAHIEAADEEAQQRGLHSLLGLWLGHGHAATGCTTTLRESPSAG